MNFLPALRALGHEVFFFDSYNKTRYHNFAAVNRALLEKVESLQPDVILAVQHIYEIWIETWRLIRKAGIGTTINWMTDDSWKYGQFSRFLAPCFDAVATTYRTALDRYRSDGYEHAIQTQWAASTASMQQPIRAADCTYPVSFVGTAHGNRKATVERLRKDGIEVSCFGYGWPSGPVQAEAIPEIIRSSVISLNFANTPSQAHSWLPREVNQIKARLFEAPGAGGFLLTEAAPDLSRYYVPGKEVATFDGYAELASRIRHYLAHPRERDEIALAGYERTRREHTYEHRFAEVLDFACERSGKRLSFAPLAARGCVDWASFEEVCRRHRLTETLKVARAALRKGCRLVWGKERAERAARRITYELSWRLCGARTYQAEGLPGRMFYIL